MIDTSGITQKAQDLARQAAELAEQTQAMQAEIARAHGADPVSLFTVFVLACFVGYFVVWKVTPALHTPLMSVTNAISGIVIVGAVIALGTDGSEVSHWAGFAAVALASVNIFGGFIVTQRMLAMFQKKSPVQKKP